MWLKNIKFTKKDDKKVEKKVEKVEKAEKKEEKKGSAWIAQKLNDLMR